MVDPSAYSKLLGIFANHDKTPKKREVLKSHGVTLGRASLAEQLAHVPSKKIKSAVNKATSLTGVTIEVGLRKEYTVPSRAGMREIAFQAIALLVQSLSTERLPSKEQVDELRRTAAPPLAR